ncbi:hypothetical protein HAX54_019142, partial [Datura stramonium]|nr:hypothetical protein [Datura stramonium]
MAISSAAIVSSAAIGGTRMFSEERTTKVKYINGFNNSFGGQKANNPMCTPNIVSSLKTPSSQAIDAILSERKAKKHFVLVHTGCHGAWSWYKIVDLMRSAGHNVTALDMGVSGINSKKALEISSYSDYLSPLMEFMASLPADKKDVVLVGHSFGGLAISKAMETFPEKISTAVFVAALMPGPTFNANTVYTE